ncbi:unnamed protein product [Fraxinus pennsylvanica]|uniref:Uncharacterized protein n=1 Tax=Fraxinus pennsylvanica TaxID=56036 RepID=A0AAD1YVU0_9LAMI|nr:unnamed protein product [Fraxinus pennsylvanica]
MKRQGENCEGRSENSGLKRSRLFNEGDRGKGTQIEVRAQNKRQGARPLATPLVDLSLRALAENAEGIVSLELIPDWLKERLTILLCHMRKMDVHMLNLLVKPCPTVIRVKNCSWLTETQFRQTFGNFDSRSLRVLQLDLCGQCMLDLVLTDTLARSLNSLPNLAIGSLRGACSLSDSGLKALVMSAPALLSINLGHCTLLTCAAIRFISYSLGSKLRELYIDGCQNIDAMLILPALRKFEHLEVLSVAGISTVSDQFISEVIRVCGRGIKELDLANCPELTDRSLKIIGSTCADLRSLNISNLHNLTDLGIEYLTNCCRSIQKLNLCNNGFSDEAIAAFLKTSGGSLMELVLKKVRKALNSLYYAACKFMLISPPTACDLTGRPNAAFSLTEYSRKLLSLDISWCRRITNEELKSIVGFCSLLKVLKIYGCSQISDEILNGDSNPFVRILGLELDPLFEPLSLNEPKEVFLRYSPLPVSPEY